MIFSSYPFLLFLAIVFFTYSLLNRYADGLYARIWLVLASFYFYAQGSPNFLPFFIFTIFFNYGLSMLLIKSQTLARRRLLLAIGLLENLALLGYFKYVDFFISNTNLVFGTAIPLQNILLPIGISFFTFQLIAYLVDCYRGKTAEYSLLNFLLFITFFPQLIVGPIVHHSQVVPQFADSRQRIFSSANMLLGLYLFSIGAAKKILLADPLTRFGDSFFMNVAGGNLVESWIAVLSYTFSLYFDMSGYADMAIGLGLFFNIILPQNFNSPLKARNFREYWRRWHMTLSRFLADYVFRTIYPKDSRMAERFGGLWFYFAVMTTFLVSGFWHGAGWRFIIWGIINGTFVCAAHFMAARNWRLPDFAAWPLFFIGLIATRILFFAGNTSHALSVVRKMFDFSAYHGWAKTAILQDWVAILSANLYTVGVLAVAAAITFFFNNSMQMKDEFTASPRQLLFAGIIFGLALFQMTDVVDFVYFQF